eukprot:872246-Pleurochrysis_carterae.AAC.1
MRGRLGLPVLGSQELFKKMWSSHTEIRQYSAKAHSKCDDCGKFESALNALGKRADAEAVAERAKIRESSVNRLPTFHS